MDRDWRLDLVVFVVEFWAAGGVQPLGLGAAIRKVVGCRKGFTAVPVPVATGAEDEGEGEGEGERSSRCCLLLLSSTVIGTSSSPSSLRNGGGRFIGYRMSVRRS